MHIICFEKLIFHKLFFLNVYLFLIYLNLEALKCFDLKYGLFIKIDRDRKGIFLKH